MPVPTPPTAAQVVATLPNVAPRVSVVRNEIIRILETELPAVIALQNVTLASGIKMPASIRPGPVELESTSVDAMLVEIDLETFNQSPQSFAGRLPVAIHSINKRQALPQQIDGSTDLLGFVMGIFWFRLSGWTDLAGRKVWNQMLPKGQTGLPPEYARYVGATLRYELVQGAGHNCWTV